MDVVVHLVKTFLDKVFELTIDRLLGNLGVKDLVALAVVSIGVLSVALHSWRRARVWVILAAFAGLFVSDILLIAFGPLAGILRYLTALILGWIAARVSSRSFINAFVPLSANLGFDYLTAVPGAFGPDATVASIWTTYLTQLLLMTLSAWVGFKAGTLRATATIADPHTPSESPTAASSGATGVSPTAAVSQVDERSPGEGSS